MHALNLAIAGREQQHIARQIEDGAIIAHAQQNIRAARQVTTQARDQCKFIQHSTILHSSPLER